jgi:hypothetical protein
MKKRITYILIDLKTTSANTIGCEHLTTLHDDSIEFFVLQQSLSFVGFNPFAL